VWIKVLLVCLQRVCAVTRRRFPVGARPTRQPLQLEATGAVMDGRRCRSRWNYAAHVKQARAERYSSPTSRRSCRRLYWSDCGPATLRRGRAVARWRERCGTAKPKSAGGNWSSRLRTSRKTAIFRQVNLDCPHAHHDALEFPDGEIVLLIYLMEGQQATVLQLPAAAVGSKAPERAVYV
jgi:hypothetical protein